MNIVCSRLIDRLERGFEDVETCVIKANEVRRTRKLLERRSSQCITERGKTQVESENAELRKASEMFKDVLNFSAGNRTILRPKNDKEAFLNRSFREFCIQAG